MIGLLVLGIAALWLTLAAKMARATAARVKARLAAGLVGFAVFSIVSVAPFADEIIGRWQFHQLCEAKASVWVHPNAANVAAARSGTSSKEIKGLVFPVQERIIEYFDLATGDAFLRLNSFHTPGGLIMRAGLNMGGTSSCRAENWGEPYKKLPLDELIRRGKA
ncbi:MAG: hypothetical protein KF892_23510 [Rhizobacter sp.]|nr:hypothetical protein [Rhizobacter sp.]